MLNIKKRLSDAWDRYAQTAVVADLSEQLDSVRAERDKYAATLNQRSRECLKLIVMLGKAEDQVQSNIKLARKISDARDAIVEQLDYAYEEGDYYISQLQEARESLELVKKQLAEVIEDRDNLLARARL